MVSSGLKGLELAKIETALRDSEERLRLAIEASGIGIFSIDLSSGVAHYSPELSRILGFPGVAEARIDDAFARVHRDDQTRLRKEYAETLDPASSGRLDMNFRFVRPGGEVRWMSWSGRVHFDEEPVPRKPVRIVGTCVDTTERFEAEARLRASEARLRDSEERLRLAIEASGIGIFSIDLSSGVAHYSPELSRILGFPGVAEARLEDAFARVHRDDQGRVRKQFEEALDPASGGRLDTDFRFVRPGGKVRWMSWSGRVHFDEEPVPSKPARIVGTCVDTTERFEAEARLRASEARLTSEAHALTKLNALSSRLWRTDRLQEGLEEMLAATIDCSGPTWATSSSWMPHAVC